MRTAIVNAVILAVYLLIAAVLVTGIYALQTGATP